MSKIIIRPCNSNDEDGILEVCYKTGYMGEDLTNMGIFNDVKLFGYLFCLYYIRYENENCFVAVDISNNNKIVGYIIGTLDSKTQERLFKKKMLYKIALRLLLHTSWKHPESLKQVISFIKSLDLKNEPKNLYKEYPSHLHINILSEYQHKGVGTMLINKFETHVRENNIDGIHLRTSSKNIKALPFYYGKGYNIIYENYCEVWKDVKEYKSLILGKKFNI
ncbi:Acetyltransferase (GNAT) family protein [Clostridium liquoris]|jgi:ribosomal protein S18 acetylase RimI-like enzyme|uniref:Acetyltransferase (GNAT) family protein n=1 Tax=Clostridium liquoris TaxID=1289519 RepID=A0A2T0B3Q9_9CLOT|nr:GNAT family N-acetyltransferase [Clostridium liquoris]PRR78515.1 Acetyltransferase (GNAT) family protein [Clostridium liquoris]